MCVGARFGSLIAVARMALVCKSVALRRRFTLAVLVVAAVLAVTFFAMHTSSNLDRTLESHTKRSPENFREPAGVALGEDAPRATDVDDVVRPAANALRPMMAEKASTPSRDGGPQAGCDVDEHCAQAERCVGRRCVAGTRHCDGDADCATAQRCIFGRCAERARECDDDTDCSTAQFCQLGLCSRGERMCTNDANCEEGHRCEFWPLHRRRPRVR